MRAISIKHLLKVERKYIRIIWLNNGYKSYKKVLNFGKINLILLTIIRFKLKAKNITNFRMAENIKYTNKDILNECSEAGIGIRFWNSTYEVSLLKGALNKYFFIRWYKNRSRNSKR